MCCDGDNLSSPCPKCTGRVKVGKIMDELKSVVKYDVVTNAPFQVGDKSFVCHLILE